MMSAKHTFAASCARLAVCGPRASVISSLAHECPRSLFRSDLHRPLARVHRGALRPISNSQKTVDTRCPACLAPPNAPSPQVPLPTATAICHNCASFLPLTRAGSHFSLFGLPQAYRLDRSALRQQYHRWQQVVHPDLAIGRQSKNSTAPDRELQASLGEQWSIAVNRARATLENDIKRAAYMLELDGRLAMPEEGGDSSVDPALLMMIMETHEELEDANSEAEVEAIQALNKEKMQETIAELERLWTPDCRLEIADLERARVLAVSLKYMDTIDGACREWRPSTT